jgi:hypothetical protein
MNSSRDQTVLTDEGRKRLTERARRLRDETIPALISAIEAAEQDASLQMELDLAANELQRLTYLLELPDRPPRRGGCRCRPGLIRVAAGPGRARAPGRR